MGICAGLVLGGALLSSGLVFQSVRRMALSSHNSGLRTPSQKVVAVSDQPHFASQTSHLTGAGTLSSSGLKMGQAARKRAAAKLARLPVSFEPNEGQADPRVQFLSRSNGFTLLLERDGAVLDLPNVAAPAVWGKFREATGSSLAKRKQAPRTHAVVSSVLRLELVGGNRSAQVSGEQRLPGKSNYFIGANSRQWRTNVPQFGRVRYRGVYPGVDLVYYGDPGQLEYDFVVAPGADPGKIRWNFAGLAATAHGSTLRIDSHGNLIVQMEGNRLVFHKPVVYQPGVGRLPVAEAANERGLSKSGVKVLNGSYLVSRNNQVSFSLDAYDKTKPLVIDPTLSYSTYLGGTGNDQADDVVLDSAGNIYMIGTTASANFPLQNAYQSTCTSCVTGSPDVFITELSADGSKLVFSTFLGGSSEDDGNGIALDSSGNIYIDGRSFSSDFPVSSNAFQPTCLSCSTGLPDVFAAELPPGGASLTYSTYLGGTGEDDAFGIAVDSSGDAYIVGRTNSSNFPTQSPYQSTLKGGFDIFVTKFKPLGAGLVYSTYLGGLSQDYGFAIAVDSKGGAYVTGQTTSNDFPTTTGAYQTSFGGNQNVFVAKFKPSGAGLAYSTYLGGTGQDSGRSIAVDAAGNAYVAGATSSTSFPVLNAPQPNFGGGGSNGFIAKLNPAGSALVYSTYLGGSGTDIAGSIALDKGNRAYIAGETGSTNFPMANALTGQSKYSGNQDAFVTKLSPGGCAFAFSTYLGGISQDIANGIAVTPAGNPVVVGETTSNNFPVTSNAFQSKTAGKADVFVSLLTGLTGPVDCFSPAVLKFSGQVVTTTSSAQTVTLTNDGENLLSISTIGTTAEFTETNTCIGSGSSTGTVQPGSNCTISLTFTPVGPGNQLGALTVTDNGPNSPHTIAMNGVGQDFAFTANPPSVTIGAGRQAQYTVTVSPISGFNQTVALTCAGAPPDSTCTLNPKSVTLDGTSAQTVTLAVATTARSGNVFPRTTPRIPPALLRWKLDLAGMIFLVLLTILSVAVARRQVPGTMRRTFRTGAVMFAVLALVLLFWSSCGGNGTLPTGTPVGKYGITVTGTDGTLSHGVQLGLKVN